MPKTAALRQRASNVSVADQEGGNTNNGPGTSDYRNISGPKGKRIKQSPSNAYIAVISASGLIVATILLSFSSSTSITTTSNSNSNVNSNVNSNSNARNQDHNHARLPWCVNNFEDLPLLWRPTSEVEFEASEEPWSQEESDFADQALETALRELTNFYNAKMTPDEVMDFQPDGLNSLIDMAYSTQGDFHRRAMQATRDMYLAVTVPFLKPTTTRSANGDDEYDDNVDDNGEKNALDAVASSLQGCKKQYYRMKMADYGNYLVERLPDDTELTTAYKAVVVSVQEMIDSCGSLDRILKLNIDDGLFEDLDADSDTVYGYLMKAIGLVELKTIPELRLPANTDWFVDQLWTYYLPKYHLLNPRMHPEHYWHGPMLDHAWLATHIAYVPTGYGRHRQQIDDAPYLYRYIRENYYLAMEYGRLDLISEFVDLIRTYGCTEENDYQLRHGTRWVLNWFDEHDRRWIDYDHDHHKHHHHTTSSYNNNYNMIHMPWTGSAAVMIHGVDEPVVPGSYGQAFHDILRSEPEWASSAVDNNES